MKTNNRLHTIVFMGLFIALCYVAFEFLKIPVPGTGAYIHMGNALCLLAVLVFADGQETAGGILKGAALGGICGALGMGIADLTSPGCLPWFPSTLLLKFSFAMIAGLLLAFLTKSWKSSVRILLACAAAMLFNLIAAPLANYLTNVYLVGADSEASAIVAAWSSVPSGVNAVVSAIAAPAVYAAMRPLLRKMQK